MNKTVLNKTLSYAVEVRKNRMVHNELIGHRNIFIRHEISVQRCALK